MEVLRVWNEWKKYEKSERMRPPENPCGDAGFCDKKCGQIGDHQHEDQQSNEAGLPREFLAKPPRTHKEEPYKKPGNPDCAHHGECSREVEIEATKCAGRI